MTEAIDGADSAAQQINTDTMETLDDSLDSIAKRRRLYGPLDYTLRNTWSQEPFPLPCDCHLRLLRRVSSVMSPNECDINVGVRSDMCDSMQPLSRCTPAFICVLVKVFGLLCKGSFIAGLDYLDARVGVHCGRTFALYWCASSRQDGCVKNAAMSRAPSTFTAPPRWKHSRFKANLTLALNEILPYKPDFFITASFEQTTYEFSSDALTSAEEDGVPREQTLFIGAPACPRTVVKSSKNVPKFGMGAEYNGQLGYRETERRGLPWHATEAVQEALDHTPSHSTNGLGSTNAVAADARHTRPQEFLSLGQRSGEDRDGGDDASKRRNRAKAGPMARGARETSTPMQLAPPTAAMCDVGSVGLYDAASAPRIDRKDQLNVFTHFEGGRQRERSKSPSDSDECAEAEVRAENHSPSIQPSRMAAGPLLALLCIACDTSRKIA